MLANICKLNVTQFPYEIARLAHDIAGGVLVTLPSEKDFRSPEVGPYLDKYFKSAVGYGADRCRVQRLIENLTLGMGAVGYLTESMHGAGSPQAQKIMIGRLANLRVQRTTGAGISGDMDRAEGVRTAPESARRTGGWR